MAITRYSSRSGKLKDTFLLRYLQGARSYKRIAGYFTSSLFEIAGEALDSIPDVRIVCNSELSEKDLRIAHRGNPMMVKKWRDLSNGYETLLNHERYQKLDNFLLNRSSSIRVASDDICGFVHGKAGVIECADGTKIGFIGSINETQKGWNDNYEILWQDTSSEGIAWIEEEFEFLWNKSKPISEAVTQEIRRIRNRREVKLRDLDRHDAIGPATLIESPLYSEGQELMPWQHGFLSECLRHYKNHGNVRLLLADEVGLGKTLSLGTAALVLSLLDEKEFSRQKPVLILAPATLCEQWQTEMIDKLGIPCARWKTSKKCWVDHQDIKISPGGTIEVTKCPRRIGIVSTGLINQDSDEKNYLKNLNFGIVILDEAHRARTRRGRTYDPKAPNELLQFTREIACRSDHVLLGTATPIQIRPEDLWDLVEILDRGKEDFVLGNRYSNWHRPDDILPLLTGESKVRTESEGWTYLRLPLPHVNSTDDTNVKQLLAMIRQELKISERQTDTTKHLTDLQDETREKLSEELLREDHEATFFQRENPFVRHIVLRRRKELEKIGLLQKIGVDLFPNKEQISSIRQYDTLFEGNALRTNENFKIAYQEAIKFGEDYKAEGRGSGFMKNLMQQRVCSSIHAGIKTAKRLIAGSEIEDENNETHTEQILLTNIDKKHLNLLVNRLKMVDFDPKLSAILHFLKAENWLQLGSIIFSQYYDTALWVAKKLAKEFTEIPIGLYAGASRSKLLINQNSKDMYREQLKQMVADQELKIMVATDAACEGLNLQSLGTLINIDLPWNPTKLEQRLGRIKRIGQERETVKMLNLVNEETVDQVVYDRLSVRMQDRYNLFGTLPDTIDADWIKDDKKLDEELDKFIDAKRKATGFELRYRQTNDTPDSDWHDCFEVLSRRDFNQLMNSPWKTQTSVRIESD